MKRIHHMGGLAIVIFITFHLINHLAGVFGAESHLAVMEKLRVVYRNPFIETILFIAVAVQIFSGIRLSITKWKSANLFFEKLQIWSGLYIAVFFLIHLSAVLTGRYILQLDTNFYFGVAGLNTFPHNLFFIPYYALAILSFFAHVAAIHTKKMEKVVFGISVNTQSNLILLVGFIITVIIFYGLTNGFTGVEIPTEYGVLVGK
ncbi:MAG: hypothetical protein CMO01_07115 [Thalassobius sp.]|nr:hypothetical protein [Thalassovita sp.]